MDLIRRKRISTLFHFDSKKEMFAISGANYEFGSIRNPHHLPWQTMIHKFSCHSNFGTLTTMARMKVVQDMNLQVLEFQLKSYRAVITMQILMPIEANMHTLMLNFHNFGFDLMDAVLDVPYSPNVNVLLPILSLTKKTALKETLISLGLNDLFRKDNSDFIFDDNEVIE